MYIDSHLHLDFDDFAADRDQVLARAANAGVGAFVTIGIRVRDFDRVLATARAYPNVWCTLGTLPHHADEEADVTTEELVALAQDPKVVGIGECGLDTFFGDATWDNQIKVFRAHIAAARETGLPLIIHSVKQDEAMGRMLTEEYEKGPFRILMHGFSGHQPLADTCVALGAHFSFSGLLSYPDNGHIREVAAALPADRLLLETDAPSLAPLPLAPEARNEPANITHIAALLASLRGTTPEEIGRITTANFYDAYPKIPRP